MVRSHPESLEAIKYRLRLLRLALGLNKSAMAERVGTSPQAWGNWENTINPHRISIDEALKVCRASGASLDWIYRGDLSTVPHSLAQKIVEADNQGTPEPKKKAG